MDFVPFPSIEGFSNVVKLLDKYPEIATKIMYRGKIKLHGTNAGVRVVGGQVQAQSRTRLITPQDDNMGFAKWVESRKEFFAGLTVDRDITIFGEWCGQGIMSGTAISQINKKIFAIFAIVVKQEGDEDYDNFMLVEDPSMIRGMLGFNLPDDIKVLPWVDSVPIEVDFTSESSKREAVDRMNAVVENFEPCDPWVLNTFGIKGIAEGVVYYPVIVSKSREFGVEHGVSHKRFGDLTFKAKGAKHQEKKQNAPVTIDPEVAASIDEFVDMFVTPQRLEHGIFAIFSAERPTMQGIGKFIKWMNEDILKESADELEASDLTWEQVQRPVTNKAKTWFMERYK